MCTSKPYRGGNRSVRSFAGRSARMGWNVALAAGAASAFGAATWAGQLVLGQVVQPGVYFRQDVANNTGAAANDLAITFSGQISGMKVSPYGSPGGTYAGTLQPAPPAAANTYLVPSTAGMSVRGGSEAQVRWRDVAGTTPSTITGGTWTVNGVAAAANPTPATMGGVIGITRDQFTGVASVTFTNSEPFAVNYTNVAYWVNNSLDNYTIDSFDIPTGSSVPDSSSFSLAASGNPSDSLTVSLGTVDTVGYELVTATVAAQSAPSTTYTLGAAAAAPEPAALALMGIAAGALLLIRRPRKESVH